MGELFGEKFYNEIFFGDIHAHKVPYGTLLYFNFKFNL